MNEDPNNTTIPASEKPAAGVASATILQVLPAMGEGGGVERGTVEITQAIAAEGGRALVVSAGGAREPEIKRGGGEHLPLPVPSKNPWTTLP